MDSVSNVLLQFAFHAALGSAGLIAVLLFFIAARRFYRGRYFAKLDEQAFSFRHRWNYVISFRVSPKAWRKNRFKRAVVERIVLARLESSTEPDRTIYQDFIRRSALMETRGTSSRA